MTVGGAASRLKNRQHLVIKANLCHPGRQYGLMPAGEKN